MHGQQNVKILGAILDP